eukprot:5989217-Alexandrium_andersonii.AAC.1
MPIHLPGGGGEAAVARRGHPCEGGERRALHLDGRPDREPQDAVDDRLREGGRRLRLGDAPRPAARGRGGQRLRP